MGIKNPKQADLDAAYWQGIRVLQVGAGDGITPDVAADLGFRPAKADSAPEGITTSTLELPDLDENIPGRERDWKTTEEQRSTGRKALAAMRANGQLSPKSRN